MDRFERHTSTITGIAIILIYIPIWIDLKDNLGCIFVNLERIYIPIWIDLKVNGHEVQSKNLSYLHSNMDRFERPFMCLTLF